MSSAVPGDVFSRWVGRDGNGVMFRCPGCLTLDRIGIHSIATRPHAGKEPSWDWNGDVVRPVLGPSILARWNEGPRQLPQVCHSFVGCNGAAPGQIIFLGDSTHALAGKVVDLPPWIDSVGADGFGDVA